ncbi:hypothetical protein N7478_012139 [Penicillium angulare]|uniref:uncharacterized protein n=1 Tax=Penicillium angulare TaxID=116970 RepID=UPI00253FB085|nr:uncharacterized protein N7478_012139 [Penicillium angulare]KAJ5260534.1 hypothetical protein N7478_012139 [Penicillium angulare]
MAPTDKYTDPKLRDQVKEEIHRGDKGGKPGQWSARKAQMMAAEYKKRGGSYNTSKEEGQSETQRHLDQWTKEDWQTKEGSGTAKKENGTRKRYLPKQAWEQMSDDEKEETDKKKVNESKKGKQFVGNTSKAKLARKDASRDARGSQDESQHGSTDDAEEHTHKHNTRARQTRSSDRKKNTSENNTPKKEAKENGASKQGAGRKRSADQSKKPKKKTKNQQQEEVDEDEDEDEGKE